MALNRSGSLLLHLNCNYDIIGCNFAFFFFFTNIPHLWQRLLFIMKVKSMIIHAVSSLRLSSVPCSLPANNDQKVVRSLQDPTCNFSKGPAWLGCDRAFPGRGSTDGCRPSAFKMSLTCALAPQRRGEGADQHRSPYASGCTVDDFFC